MPKMTKEERKVADDKLIITHRDMLMQLFCINRCFNCETPLSIDRHYGCCPMYVFQKGKYIESWNYEIDNHNNDTHLCITCFMEKKAKA